MSAADLQQEEYYEVCENCDINSGSGKHTRYSIIQLVIFHTHVLGFETLVNIQYIIVRQ